MVKKKRKQKTQKKTQGEGGERKSKKARKFFLVHPQGTILSFVQESEIPQPVTAAVATAALADLILYV